MREGEDVVLSCEAGGHPAPSIKWRREDGGVIRQGEGSCIVRKSAKVATMSLEGPVPASASDSLGVRS